MARGPGDRLGAGDGERQRRVRLLERLGIDGHVVNLPVRAGEVDAVLGPCLEQDVDAFLHALAALLLRHAVAVELHRAIAATEADDQPTATQNVESRGFFGQPQRMVERDDVDGGAERGYARSARRPWPAARLARRTGRSRRSGAR